MKAADKCRRPSASVSASELAQMGVCERLVVFEHRYGKRCLPEQQAAIECGQREHEQFYREGRIASAPPGRRFKKWCSQGNKTRPACEDWCSSPSFRSSPCTMCPNEPQ